jgi:hypothetical protein
VADDAAAECEEGFVDVGAAVVADEQPFELVQPGEGALDHPAVAAETGAMLCLAPGDLWPDPASSELAPLWPMVVGAIGGDSIGPSTRPADLAAHGRHTLDQRHELGYVVAVAARERPGERDPGRVDEEVMLGAQSGSINRARARRAAPFFACT